MTDYTVRMAMARLLDQVDAVREEAVMREVFTPPADMDPDPVHGVFYTITVNDVGKTAPIKTTAGLIPVSEVLGRVMRMDVGKRVYAVLSDDKTRTVWQAENDAQRDARMSRQAGGTS